MQPVLALKAFQDGIGATLGGIAAVIGLGAMLGKLLAESGGAQVLAERFTVFFGPSRVGMCIVALALAVGLVTWFCSGPAASAPGAGHAGAPDEQPFLLLAIPLVSFLSVMHGLMPPHPGPVVAIDMLGANTGGVLGLGFIVGIPTAALAGPLFARWAVHHVPVPTPKNHRRCQRRAAASRLRRDHARGGAANRPHAPRHGRGIDPAGQTFDARDPGLSRASGGRAHHRGLPCTLDLWPGVQVHSRPGAGFTEQSIGSIGMTLLVVGGGGGFARVLREAGVADALGTMAGEMHLPPLVYGWLVAAFIRVATGSSTVAITAASGLMIPILTAHPHVNASCLCFHSGLARSSCPT